MPSASRTTGRPPAEPPAALPPCVPATGQAAALADRFAAALRALGLPDGPLLLAVSGGGDSIALMHLMHGRPELRHRLAVATVDHGLRPDAAAEAAQVGRWAAELGLRHHLLQGRSGEMPAGGLQAAARDLRYRLLDGAASAIGGAAILLAHNADDQAETVAMRLRRGGDHDGLGAMAPVVRRHDLAGAPLVLRPLLDFGRAELRDWLRSMQVRWLEDPSNRDLRFERIRVRQGLADTGQRARLVATAAAARHRARHRDQRADGLLRRALALSPHGDDRLSLAPLLEAGEDLACHVLRGLLATGGTLPRRVAVARLWRELAAGCPGITLAGRRFHRLAAGRYLVLRDRRSPLPALPLAPGLAARWGGRFGVSVPDRREGGTGAGRSGPELRELGAVSPIRAARLLCDDRRHAAVLMGLLHAVPAPARPGMPAVYCGDRIVGLPTLQAAAAARAGAFSATDFALWRLPLQPFRPWHWEALEPDPAG